MFNVPEIMVTVGPTLETAECFGLAIEAGARWFRLPCGYRQRPHLTNAADVRRAAAQSRIPVQLLLDLPSSRPRTGKMPDLSLAVGAVVKFVDAPQVSEGAQPAEIPRIPLPGLGALLGELSVGHRMWFCDGRLEFRVEEVHPDGVLACLQRCATLLKSSNSLYLPDSLSPFTMVTPADRDLLRSFAAEHLIPDWVALSLVATADDVEAGRDELRRQLATPVRVMAKIETTAAVERIDSILRVSDGIMVARGDLGPAVEFIRLPEVQEQLVAAAQRAGKPVVVATQIVECFAEVGMPQRAELSGLAVLAQQHPDAVMLGKETVYSPRPIECIRLVREVLTFETRRLAARRRTLPARLAVGRGEPRVVAIEGPNGAGKTCLCQALGQRLGLPQLRGVPAAWEEPALKLHMIRDADWLASAMYFLSGVIEAARDIPAGGAKLMVMDRSLWSTLAVHYAHDPERLERLLSLLELAADRLRVPDLTIVLEASPATCSARIAGKSGQERQWDAASPADAAFARRERDFYAWLATQGPKVAFLPTDGRDAEDVCRRAAALIRESF
ncbi:MAG: pyruvate kinase [Thermoguttaceae bacterium]|jgi:pyruvate kinase/thymidylate kinase